MQTSEPERSTPRQRIVVKEEDLEELYLLVQGAPYANSVIDARMSLAQKDLATTLNLLESARERYRQSHRKTLRQDIGEVDEGKKGAKEKARRLKQQQDRCRHVLEAFDDIVAILERMIKLRAGGKEATDLTGAKAATTRLLLQPGSDFRREYETASSSRLQLATIRRYFDVRRVSSSHDVIVDELYFLRGKEHTYLIQIQDVTPGGDKMPIQLALSGQLMKPISKQKLLDLGNRRTLLRLVPKQQDSVDDSSNTHEILSESRDDSDAEPQRSEVLDIGSFTQLLDAAERSGLVTNAGLIAHVRDREFRRKDYQKAFQVIEGLFGKFSAAATQRDQRLRRENLDIASGKVRMSPKQLMEKRARDVAETQCVDRARNRFLRVLEGLRVLMHN